MDQPDQPFLLADLWLIYDVRSAKVSHRLRSAQPISSAQPIKHTRKIDVGPRHGNHCYTFWWKLHHEFVGLLLSLALAGICHVLQFELFNFILSLGCADTVRLVIVLYKPHTGFGPLIAARLLQTVPGGSRQPVSRHIQVILGGAGWPPDIFDGSGWLQTVFVRLPDASGLFRTAFNRIGIHGCLHYGS